MIPYWFMYALPVLLFFILKSAPLRGQNLLWWFIGIFFTIMIGFRYQVGGDWGSYLRHYDNTLNRTFLAALSTNDPGYAALNWFSGLVGGEIYLVNLIAGAIVMTGIILFARRQPLPWLAVIVTVPYMLTVMAMGYTRQSIALGFILIALVALSDGKLKSFVALVILGALFHKTAVLLLPFAALAETKRKGWTYTWVGITMAVAFGLLVSEGQQEHLWTEYVAKSMESSGGGIRVAMNALPALLFLLFRQRLVESERERKLWIWVSIFALACIPLLGVATTAVDRVALYFMPIQMLVFTRIHLIVREFYRPLLVWSIVGGYALVHWVWLNYATHAIYWVPYRFAPFIESLFS